jgi:ATP/maltotriose-dependent transcriptional regulator MalT
VNMSSKDIARLLALSVRTVETHRLHIRRKTGAGNRAELAEAAARLGLLGNYPLPPDLAAAKAMPGFHEDE